MPNYNEETRLWLERSNLSEKPYGHSYRGGILLLSVIKDNDKAICQNLVTQGFSHWRGVAETRPLKLNLTARVVKGRVQWDPSESQAKGPEFIVRLSIEQPHPEALYFPEDDESCRCVVVFRGEETIQTFCSKTRSRLKSRFFADKTGDAEDMRGRKWLLALAEGIKGIPGAEILMGPLIRLRNDELEEARDREIDKMFADNRQVNEKTLSAVLKLDDDNRETQALLQLTVPVLAAEFRRERGEAPHVEVSGFRVAISKGLLIRELRALWPKSTKEIEVCLAEEDYQVIEAATASDFIMGFVDSIPGNDRTKLALVFSSLLKKRPDSKILSFAAEFLAADGHDLSSEG